MFIPHGQVRIESPTPLSMNRHPFGNLAYDEMVERRMRYVISNPKQTIVEIVEIMFIISTT